MTADRVSDTAVEAAAPRVFLDREGRVWHQGYYDVTGYEDTWKCLSVASSLPVHDKDMVHVGPLVELRDPASLSLGDVPHIAEQAAAEGAIGERLRLARMHTGDRSEGAATDVIAGALCDQEERAEAAGDDKWFAWGIDDIAAFIAAALAAGVVSGD